MARVWVCALHLKCKIKRRTEQRTNTKKMSVQAAEHDACECFQFEMHHIVLLSSVGGSVCVCVSLGLCERMHRICLRCQKNAHTSYVNRVYDVFVYKKGGSRDIKYRMREILPKRRLVDFTFL